MQQSMKKILTAFAIASCAILSSCTKFLTQEPNSLVSDNAFSSAESIEASVFGIYSQLETAIGGTNFTYYLQNGSRFQDWTGDRTSMEWEQSIYMTLFSDTSSNQNLYASLYSGVNRCNAVIAGVSASEGVDEEYKRKIIAEVRLLRGEFYFVLARLYGDLPLLDETPSAVEDACIPRSSYMKVYEFIIGDLKYAKDNMRSKSEQEKVNPGKGRFYNMAAAALLSKVYIQIACYLESPEDQFFDITRPERVPDFSACGIESAQQAWTKALEEAEAVIEDPTYDLEPDYRNLFRWQPSKHPEDYLSKERIMVLQTSASSGQKLRASWRLWQNPYGTLEDTGKNSNAGRMRPNRIVWQKWGEFYNGTLGTVQYDKTQEDGTKVSTDFETKAYVTPPDDPRVAVTYGYTSVRKKKDGSTSSEACYPAKGGDPKRDAYFRKHYSATYNNDPGDADYYLLRMADVYFDAAEAAASLGDMQKAVDYVNVVHERARRSVDDPDNNPATEPGNLSASQFSSPEDLIVRIFWEREFEEHGEDHEWFITRRRGAGWLIRNILEPWNEFMCKDINLGTDAATQNTNSMWAAFGCTKDNPPATDLKTVRAALLCAFPSYEIRYNTSGIAQNDFYIK